MCYFMNLSLFLLSQNLWVPADRWKFENKKKIPHQLIKLLSSAPQRIFFICLISKFVFFIFLFLFSHHYWLHTPRRNVCSAYDFVYMFECMFVHFIIILFGEIFTFGILCDIFRLLVSFFFFHIYFLYCISQFAVSSSWP